MSDDPQFLHPTTCSFVVSWPVDRNDLIRLIVNLPCNSKLTSLSVVPFPMLISFAGGGRVSHRPENVDVSFAISITYDGRGGGDRTHDLRLKRPLLYH
jgi:hypothetical protein